MGQDCGGLQNMFLCCVPEEYANKIKESLSEIKATMANVYGGFTNIFKPRISQGYVARISGDIFDRLAEGEGINTEGEGSKTKVLKCEQLHEAITAVFEKINKTFPGAKCAPPSKESVDQMLKDSNIDPENPEKVFNREEFGEFVEKFSDHIAVQNCFRCCGALQKVEKAQEA